MEKTKRKNDTAPSRRTWRFFVVLALFLLLMVKFPIRVLIDEVLLDSLIWGAIALACGVAAIRTYRRFGKQVWRLVGVMVLCTGLAGWQVFDLNTLRIFAFPTGLPYREILGFAVVEGVEWYSIRFPSREILCHAFSEQFIGNFFIYIAIDIDREASWEGCSS